MSLAEPVADHADDIARRIVADIPIEAEDRGHIGEALQVLAEALAGEPTLTPAGIDASVAYLRNHLQAYADVQADRKRYPQIAEVKVERPWVVFGIPRGGTTFLHAVLAQDPASRSPESWEVNYPSPPPQNSTYDTDPRIERWARESASGESGAFRNTGDKEVMKKHMIGARMPQECGPLMMPVMRDTYIWALARVMNYLTWYMTADLSPAYAFHRKYLQHLQWHAPRDHWVLKYPSHAMNLPWLLQEYPDACVIQTHRAPAGAVSSLASLISTYRKTTCSMVDPHAMGLEMLFVAQAHFERPLAYRRANPDRKIIDLSHREITSAPLAVVRRIYDSFGVELTPLAEQRMKAFIGANPQGAHGEHKHHLENFGLNEGIVRERLADYYETYADLL